VIVLDSSAAVDFLVSGHRGEWVAGQLEAVDEAHAPHVLDVEVVAALRTLVSHGTLSPELAGHALEDLEQMNVIRYPHVPLLPKMWELRDNLSAADAAFVVLAEALALPLVTTDLRLVGAPGLGIEIRTP
jgi:predicted nucleic acid-binding protein